MRQRSDLERAVYLAVEIGTLALTVYVLWMYVPETAKIEIRSAFGAPFRAAADRRRVRVEMLSDVIELGAFGVPSHWTRAA